MESDQMQRGFKPSLDAARFADSCDVGEPVRQTRGYCPLADPKTVKPAGNTNSVWTARQCTQEHDGASWPKLDKKQVHQNCQAQSVPYNS